jgi:hypothetical protein
LVIGNKPISNEVEDKRVLLKEEDLLAIKDKTIRPSLIELAYFNNKVC